MTVNIIFKTDSYSRQHSVFASKRQDIHIDAWKIVCGEVLIALILIRLRHGSETQGIFTDAMKYKSNKSHFDGWN